MDIATRQALIAQYAAGPAEIAAALDGITEAELDARSAPGEWTTREIVHHLSDSETNSLVRLMRLLTETAPVIVAYDQDEYVRRFSHPGRPIDAALATFNGVRAVGAELLAQTTDADWERAGTHPEVGQYSITFWLDIYARHAHEHAVQVREARASV